MLRDVQWTLGTAAPLRAAFSSISRSVASSFSCSQTESTPAPAPQPTGLVRERKPLAIYFRRKDRVLLSFPHKSAVAFARAL